MPSGWLSPWILGLTVPVALFCALVESLPTTLDDNFTVPLVGGIAVALFSRADLTVFFGDPELPRRAAVGLAVNAAIAAAAYFARSIDVAGAVSAIVIGTLITAGLGLRGLAVMATFFVVGTAATRLGQAEKARRGLAQERGGVRGWRNAWANGAVPAALALMALLAPADARAWWVIAYAASVATAAADTCASEIGKAYGRHAVLITTLRPVPPGTEGGISAEGTLGGLAGAVVVAAAGAAAAEEARARSRDRRSRAKRILRPETHGDAQRAHRALGAHARRSLGCIRRVGAVGVAPRVP